MQRDGSIKIIARSQKQIHCVCFLEKIFHSENINDICLWTEKKEIESIHVFKILSKMDLIQKIKLKDKHHQNVPLYILRGVQSMFQQYLFSFTLFCWEKQFLLLPVMSSVGLYISFSGSCREKRSAGCPRLVPIDLGRPLTITVFGQAHRSQGCNIFCWENMTECTWGGTQRDRDRQGFVV